MSPKHWLSNKRRNHILALGLSGALAFGIGYFTLTPNPGLVLTSNDKTDHLLGFAVLLIPGALLYRHALYWLLPGAIAFGGAIELSSHTSIAKASGGIFGPTLLAQLLVSA